MADQCGAPNLRLLPSTQSSGSVRRRWTTVRPGPLLVSELADRCEGTMSMYGLKKKAEAVRDTRKIGKKDMKLNSAMPKMTGG